MKTGKSICRRLLVLIVSVAMMIGCLSGVVFADGPRAVSENEAYLHEYGSIQTKVELGKQFKVLEANEGVTLKVKDPTGKNVTADGNEYTASVLGNYKVIYSNDNVSYSYIINCFEDAEYYIEVENNGASIPTFVERGASKQLPKWHLAKKVDDEVEYVEEGVMLYYQIDNGAKTEVGDEDVSVVFSEVGSKMLVLSAQFDGSSKSYSEKYTINVQSNFTDSNRPTLRNISNMSSSASINTLVTLPKATADDDYDDNVEVIVNVTDPDGKPVKKVAPDENGYAPKMTDGEYDQLEDAKFDNIDNMSFYPTKLGTYTVTYVAKDDAGNESTQHTYKIAVSDKTGPVIIESEDDLIPTVWGLHGVQNKDGENVDMVLNIPIPTVVDNYDEFNLDAGENPGTGDVKMTVEVKNPTDTVARWSLLTPQSIMNDQHVANATEGSYKKFYKSNSGDNVYEGVKIVTEGGGNPYLRINFDDFYSEESDESNSDDDLNKVKAGVTGIWTITFSFRDGASNGGYNNSQKVYSIDVRDFTFTDEEAPVITEPTFPDYIIVDSEETTYTVPNIVVSDNFDSRLTENYYIYSGDDNEDNRLYVEGGEVLNLGIDEDGNSYLANEDGDKITISDSISFAYSAKDDVENEAQLKDEDGNDYSVTVYAAKNGWAVEDVKFDIEDEIIDGYIGEFAIEKIEQPEFVGFELSIKDEDGNSLDGVTSNVFYTEGENKALYVKDIRFNPGKSGDYEVNIRLFDAKNNSYVFAKKLTANVDDDKVTIGNRNAALWDRVGNARRSYMLERRPFTVNGSEADKYIRVFKIRGGRYSLLGYEFTPIDQGGYEVTEYYGKQDELIAESDNFASLLTYNASYGMSVSDANSARIDTDDVIPSYIKDLTKEPESKNKYQGSKGEYFYITPHFIAFSESQSYDVSLKYTDPDGNSANAQKVYEYVGEDANIKEGDEKYYSFKAVEGEYEYHGSYAFTLDKNGAYNLEATAKIGSDVVTENYTIKVGDIIAPQFTLTDTSTAKANVDTLFEYRTFKLEDMQADKDPASEITVYYSLYEPGSSNSQVSSVSGSIKLDKLTASNDGEYRIKLDNDYKFAKSGDYTVRIVLRDKAGNESTRTYTITVSTTTSSTPTSLTMLSTVLIIVGILLIIGVVVYLIRFRKRRA